MTTEKLPFWKTDRFWWGIYLLVTLFVSVKEMFFSPQTIGIYKTGNGNFTIFYQSFQHLWEGKTLYGFYPQEYDNRYNYSPFFAAFMGFFGWLPYPIAGLFWNIGNGLLFFSGLRQLSLERRQRVFIYWFVVFEAYTSLINYQTNPSITGVVIWTMVFFERKQYLWAACMLMLGTWVKLIGAVAGIFWLIYPKKAQFVGYCLLWSVVFFLFPLFFVSFKQLLFLYHEWYVWLTKHNEMHGNTDGLLNMHALFKKLFRVSISNGIFLGIASLTLLGSLAYQRRQLEETTFKHLVLANILIFLTIFNPGAESPTFVIAMTGVALWYVYSPASSWHTGLAIFAFILTGLSQTDLFPPYLRHHFTHPYALKALPCAVIWVVSAIELYLYKPARPQTI